MMRSPFIQNRMIKVNNNDNIDNFPKNGLNTFINQSYLLNFEIRYLVIIPATIGVPIKTKELMSSSFHPTSKSLIPVNNLTTGAYKTISITTFTLVLIKFYS